MALLANILMAFIPVFVAVDAIGRQQTPLTARRESNRISLECGHWYRLTDW